MNVYAFRTVMLSICLVTPVLSANPAAKPRVALIYSDYGDYRHKDDYDHTMKRLGWQMDYYENTQLDKLFANIDTYDIILGSALFNYSNVQPFGSRAADWTEAVASGKALIFTDINYTSHVEWFSELRSDLAVQLQPQDGKHAPMSWLDQGHPIFNIPHRLRNTGSTWMAVQAGDGWDVVSRGKDSRPTGLFRSWGQGFLLATCYWNYSSELLTNVWRTLQLHRRGILPRVPDQPELVPGRNELPVTAVNVGVTRWQLELLGNLAVPGAPPAAIEATLQAAPGETARHTIAIQADERGTYTLDLQLNHENALLVEYPQLNWVLPDLVDVTFIQPRPRPMPILYERLPLQTFRLGLTCHPYDQDPAPWQCQVTVRDQESILGKSRPLACRELPQDISIDLQRPPRSTTSITVTVSDTTNGTTVDRKTHRLAYAPSVSPQVVIDHKLQTLVDGKPFFPIGIYHIGNQDLPKAKKMGFNCFQGWGTTAERAAAALQAGQEHDMKVILEMSSFLRRSFRPDELRALVEDFRDHPALLAWYSVDEPRGDAQGRWCREAYQLIKETDPQHPVYLVMCNPSAFAQFSDATDILAIDPYPVPRQPVSLVRDWMLTAQEAVARERPVWCIPQLHNIAAYRDPAKGRGPTPAEERNMVYQALALGAKGLVYYPWDDGPNGLVHDQELMEAVADINAEVAELAPMLLAAKRSRIDLSGEQSENLLATCFHHENRAMILVVNLSAEATVDAAIPMTGLPVSASSWRVQFEDRSADVLDGVLQDAFAPLAVHVYLSK